MLLLFAFHVFLIVNLLNSLLEDLNVKSAVCWKWLNIINIKTWFCSCFYLVVSVKSLSDEIDTQYRWEGGSGMKVEFRVAFYYRQLEFSCLCESTAGKEENELKTLVTKVSSSKAVTKGKIIGESKEKIR